MSGPTYSIGNAAQAGPSIMSPQMTMSQLQGLANQQFNSAYQNLQAQAAQQAQAYNQALMAQHLAAGLARQQPQWMINGKTMNFDQFLDEICPDPDDPHRSYLILKYKGMK